MKKALGITGIVLALSVTAVVLRPRTVRAQSGCNVSALAGTYGYVMQGNYYYSVTGILHPAFLSSGGVFAFDGGAGLAGVDTISDDGSILHGNLNGSYTVNSDCTGRSISRTRTSTRSILIL